MDSVFARDMVKDYTASYATYVATNRAIPQVVDGLKPVWRRCINSADDLKLYHNKKHLKVSKLSGDVLGNYHPHGGANPIPLAQPFRFRYPLFDGQGNYGSPDMPDSYAAARYLEIRLSKFCEDFYLESADYADREDNYDGRLKEIVQYYPPLPGVMFTGAEGMAVGFSTKIPTHNLRDVGESLLAYIKNPNSEKYLKDIMPDTCEESVIVTDRNSIKEMYRTGEGSIRYGAKTHYEIYNGKPALVVDAFPPDFSKKRLETASILSAVERGDLELYNESSEDVRYVFVATSKDILEEVERRLETSTGYRFYIEHRGVIKRYSLREIYDVFLEERKGYILRKYTDLCNKASDELYYLNVLLALKQDKEYIKTMFEKTSREVISDIVSRYNVTESVAKRVLSVSLRSLLADNHDEILSKINELTKSIDTYNDYVRDPMKKIVSDIKEIMRLYRDDTRRSIHVDSITDTIQIEHDGTVEEVKSKGQYIVARTDNTMQIVYGEDMKSIDLNGAIICSLEYEYYMLYDERGLCAVSRDTMMTGGSKLKSDSLVGIIGINDLEKIVVRMGNKKVYKVSPSWALKKRASYVKMSNPGEPPMEILSISKD